jgi:hypothetical protein
VRAITEHHGRDHCAAGDDRPSPSDGDSVERRRFRSERHMRDAECEAGAANHHAKYCEYREELDESHTATPARDDMESGAHAPGLTL